MLCFIQGLMNSASAFLFFQYWCVDQVSLEQTVRQTLMTVNPILVKIVAHVLMVPCHSLVHV